MIKLPLIRPMSTSRPVRVVVDVGSNAATGMIVR
jgi:hypothetical protein